MQHKTFSDSLMLTYKEMTFKYSTQDGTKLYYLQVKYLQRMSWKVCKLTIRDSLQLQTVLAINDQEIDRDRVMPSNQRLTTMERRHIDLMIRARNFRAWNERIETGVLVKSQKGRKVSVERKKRMLSVERNWTVCQRRLM